MDRSARRLSIVVHYGAITDPSTSLHSLLPLTPFVCARACVGRGGGSICQSVLALERAFVATICRRQASRCWGPQNPASYKTQRPPNQRELTADDLARFSRVGDQFSVEKEKESLKEAGVKGNAFLGKHENRVVCFGSFFSPSGACLLAGSLGFPRR